MITKNYLEKINNFKKTKDKDIKLLKQNKINTTIFIEEVHKAKKEVKDLKMSILLLNLLKTREDNIKIELEKIETWLLIWLTAKNVNILLKESIHSQIRLWKWINNIFEVHGFSETRDYKKKINVKEIVKSYQLKK